MKAETRRPRGGSAQARLDAMVSALGKYFLLHLPAKALNRLADGKYIPNLAEHIASAPA